jgi:hypothetical protein
MLILTKSQIIIFLFAFCPLFIFLLSLKVWKKIKLKKSKAPFTDNFLRSPGESLFHQIQDLNERISNSIIEFVLIPIVIGTGCFVLISTDPNVFNQSITAIIICVLVIFLIYYIWKILHLIEMRRQKRLGYEGEVASGQELNQLMLDGYNVFHDFPAVRFNIDHIVVGPDAVYAVETKTRSKLRARDIRDNYKVISDGKTVRFPDYTASEFIDQAERQAKWLQGWLTKAVGDPVKVKPIVLLPGWYVERSTPDGVPVFNPKEVRQFLVKKENTLSQSLHTRIVHQLDQRCRDIEPKAVQMDRQ